MSNISSIRILARPQTELLCVDQYDVERLIGAREGADENATVGHRYPEELA